MIDLLATLMLGLVGGLWVGGRLEASKWRNNAKSCVRMFSNKAFYKVIPMPLADLDLEDKVFEVWKDCENEAQRSSQRESAWK